MLYTLRFFSSKCSLFHNGNLFGSCIIRILYTGCAKIKKIIPAPKGFKETKPIVKSVKEGEVLHWTVVPSKKQKKKKSVVCVYYRILLF